MIKILLYRYISKTKYYGVYWEDLLLDSIEVPAKIEYIWDLFL